MKRIGIKEFKEEGYLQEANRRFFHPLGLALEVIIDKDGGVVLGGIWDSRDDPEGILFDDFDHDVAVIIWHKLDVRSEPRDAIGCCIGGIQMGAYSQEEK